MLEDGLAIVSETRVRYQAQGQRINSEGCYRLLMLDGPGLWSDDGHLMHLQ